MSSINRDIARILGRTESRNPTNAALTSVADGTGLVVYATPDLLPSSGLTAGDQAFVTSNNRIYISTGSGWYNVALINSTPTFTTGPDATYSLSNDLTPTVITLLAQDSDGQVVTYSATDSGMDGIATLSQDSSVFTITPLTDSAGGNIGTFTITFQATDGIGIASELSTFTLSFGPNWTSPTETKLVASDAQAYDRFGEKVSLSADGNYAIVSTISAAGGASEQYGGAGAVYIYARSGSTWTQQAILVSPDPYTGDNFGQDVALNSDGTYAIIGAVGDDQATTYIGATYIFTRSGSTWTQQAKITPSDGQTNDSFGYSVSISSDGTYAIASSRNEAGGSGDPLSNAGAAYIFSRSGSTWTQQAKITASDAQATDYFGQSVSINSDGTYVIVGSYTEDGGSGDPLSNAGAAYIYTRSGSTWTQQQKLTASDAAANSNFGINVILNSDATYAVVGSSGFDSPSTNSGQVYIFTRSGSTWTEQQKIQSSDIGQYDYFGWSVSINSDGTYVIVGAERERGGDGSPTINAGAAYIFERSGSTWTEVKKLTASDAQANDYFGSSVSISSDASYAIVGANEEAGGAGDPLAAAGAAYIYES